MWEWISLAVAAVAFVLAMAAMGLLWRRQQCGGGLGRSGAAAPTFTVLNLVGTWTSPMLTITVAPDPANPSEVIATVFGSKFTLKEQANGVVDLELSGESLSSFAGYSAKQIGHNTLQLTGEMGSIVLTRKPTSSSSAS